VIHLLLWIARNVDETANFVFVQLIEQDFVYCECHAYYVRRDKIDLAWEAIYQEMKESGSRLSSFETIEEPEFKLSRKNGCTHVSFSPVLSSHAVSATAIL
jgi:hypothetical protein